MDALGVGYHILIMDGDVLLSWNPMVIPIMDHSLPELWLQRKKQAEVCYSLIYYILTVV